MRKCRHCKAELPPVKLSDKVEAKGFCSFAHADAYRRSRPTTPKPKKERLKSIAQELDAAAVLCQRMVRLKAADDDGYCVCITCGARKHWKEMQGGHFIERGKKATKIEEANIHPQCPQCNQWGMKSTSVVLAYRQAMVDYYGEGFVENLIARSKQPFKPTRQWIAEQVEYFKEQIEFHEKRLGVRS